MQQSIDSDDQRMLAQSPPPALHNCILMTGSVEAFGSTQRRID